MAVAKSKRLGFAVVVSVTSVMLTITACSSRQEGTSSDLARPRSTASDGAVADSAGAPAAALDRHHGDDRSPDREMTAASSPKTSSPTKSDPVPLPDEPVETTDDRVAPAQQRIQSGTLTAGSFDDVQQFAAFRDFLSTTMQSDRNEVLPRLPIGRRVMIHVRNAQGQPIGNARVEVFLPGAENQSAKPSRVLTTGSDGRAMLLTGLDAPGHGHQNIRIRVEDGAMAQTQLIDTSREEYTITFDRAKARLPVRLDLALVVDATGSMSDELEYLKVEIDSIVRTVQKMFPNVDQRFALVVYRDAGDQYVTRKFDFTSSLQEFRKVLADQSADGGGDYPEAMHVALEDAAELNWRDKNTARLMFLVGDAPPHDQFADQTIDAVQQLRTRGVRIYPVASSGVQLKAEVIMRSAAMLTLGQYLFLTDHSGVGNAHAAPHVAEYQVERLDRLMIRMVASELAGKRLAAREVIAIERGEADPATISVQPEETSQASADSRATLNERLNLAAAFPVRWLLFGLLLLSVFLVDALDKRTKKPINC